MCALLTITWPEQPIYLLFMVQPSPPPPLIYLKFLSTLTLSEEIIPYGHVLYCSLQHADFLKECKERENVLTKYVGLL